MERRSGRPAAVASSTRAARTRAVRGAAPATPAPSRSRPVAGVCSKTRTPSRSAAAARPQASRAGSTRATPSAVVDRRPGRSARPPRPGSRPGPAAASPSPRLRASRCSSARASTCQSARRRHPAPRCARSRSRSRAARRRPRSRPASRGPSAAGWAARRRTAPGRWPVRGSGWRRRTRRCDRLAPSAIRSASSSTMARPGRSSAACTAAHSPVNPPPTTTRSASRASTSRLRAAGRSGRSSQYGSGDGVRQHPGRSRRDSHGSHPK